MQPNDGDRFIERVPPVDRSKIGVKIKTSAAEKEREENEASFVSFMYSTPGLQNPQGRAWLQSIMPDATPPAPDYAAAIRQRIKDEWGI